MYEVKLPVLKWFLFDNVYSGSLGTDPNRGCFSVYTLNYKVFIKDNGFDKMLIATCTFRLPYNTKTNVEEMIIGKFEVSDFGIDVAENWIRSQFVVDDKLHYKKKSNLLSDVIYGH